MAKSKATKKKMNSYIKFIGWMAIGGVIGGLLGFSSLYFDEGIKSVFENVSMWIGEQIVPIMAVMIILAIVLSIICYRKGNALVQLSQVEEDDDNQELIDTRYDFWANIGITGTSIIMYLAFPLLGFGFGFENIAGTNLYGFLIAALLFVGIGAVVGFYQVAVVKQIRKKDPLKRGDAADWNFQKEWFESCDEAERRAIYEASYKSCIMTRTILLLATLIALMIEFFGGHGLTAAILLTACNIISTLIYTYHAMKKGVAV